MGLDPRHVIFLHIPKAGGSTLRTVLRRQYRERGIYEVRDDINGDILRFCALPEAERAGIGLLMGHMGFGLHRFLPGPAVYLTLLREPVKRVLSEFRFLKSNPYHALHGAVTEMELMDYLRSGMTGQISNGQTRLLSGAAKDGRTGIPTRRPMEQRDLERALSNLGEFFPVAGLIERYDETLLLWKRQLGWRYPRYVRENVTAPLALPPPTAEELALIRELNGLDLRLYNAVRERFDATIAAQPASFRGEVAAFRLLNRLYGKAVAARRRLSRGG